MKNVNVAIIGAGELGIQILDLLKYTTENYNPVCFFDDTKLKGTLVQGINVHGGLEDIELSYSMGLFDKLIIAIGYKHLLVKDKIYSKFKEKIPFATLIHKSCIVNKNSYIGEGVILYPGCIIDKNAIIGNNVLLNLGVIISHDSNIGDNSFLAPAVVISGFVNIKKNCFIGSNSTIIDNIIIEQNVIIGAGAVVIKNISEKGVYVGNPAKVVH